MPYENDGMPNGLPERSLGWRLLDWGTKMLANPDGEFMGQRWVYTDSQALYLLWFYAVDERGKFIYRRGMIELPKGTGKSPFLAAIALTEFLGPVVFAGWAKDGSPVGKPRPSPLVQVAAISDSAADNTFKPIREMAGSGELRKHYPSLEIYQTKLTYPGERTLEKVTASPRGREGNKSTFVCMDEMEHWIPANQGPLLYEALARNATKMSGRWIATGNAPTPGENSVGENMHMAYEKLLSQGQASNVLMYSKSVYVKDIYDEAQLRPALIEVYGDSRKVTNDEGSTASGWVDLDDVITQIYDPMTRESVARQYYLNEQTIGESSWLDYGEWMSCRQDYLMLEVTDPIALGFRGQLRKGAAVLVACRLTDGALFNLSDEGWETPENADDTWEVPQLSVDKRVREVLNTYNVKKMLCDPVSYQVMVGEWYADHEGIVEEFWTSSNTKMARGVEQFETAVKTKRIQWNDKQVNQHVLNAHIKETTQGDVIRKDVKLSKRYITGAQAAILALEASVIAIMEGALNEVDNELWTF